MIHQLVHHPRTPHTDLSSLTGLASGGAHLNPELLRKMKELFASKQTSGANQAETPPTDIIEGYGMSEGVSQL